MTTVHDEVTEVKMETITVGDHTVTVTCRNLQAEDFDDNLDSNFFEEDYTLAATTGMMVWEGTWSFVELLRTNRESIVDRLKGRRVLELGAGTGLAGLCAAKMGANMLLTDVPSVALGLLGENIVRNKDGTMHFYLCIYISIARF
eukprot:m.70291 g.70291  ORF g.70291 m.70291 type:complete len:145 (+) comp12121_c0_seq7:217-651(+)